MIEKQDKVDKAMDAKLDATGKAMDAKLDATGKKLAAAVAGVDKNAQAQLDLHGALQSINLTVATLAGRVTEQKASASVAKEPHWLATSGASSSLLFVTGRGRARPAPSRQPPAICTRDCRSM